MPYLLVIYGQTSIVEKDVHSALREAVTRYHLKEERMNMTSPQALANLLVHENLEGFDAVGLVRGGGSGLEVFNDSVLARAVASVPIPFFSAIGHAEDMTLVERLADKRFDTPTAFGTYLRMLLEDTAEELKQSKTAMLAQVRKEYQEELRKEREQANKIYYENVTRIEKEREQSFKEYKEAISSLLKENKEHTDTINHYAQLTGALEGQLREVKNRVHLSAFTWIFIVIAIIFAFSLGWFIRIHLIFFYIAKQLLIKNTPLIS